MQVELSAEREAQLNEYAKRHGQDPASAVDEMLAAALESDRRDYDEAVEAVLWGYKDLRAGQAGPAAVALDALRQKYGFPR